jgi:hypothetical protein
LDARIFKRVEGIPRVEEAKSESLWSNLMYLEARGDEAWREQQSG